MKFKAGLAVLAVSFSFSSLAQTELYVQDLNFIPKAGVLAYQGDISASKSTSEREFETASIFFAVWPVCIHAPRQVGLKIRMELFITDLSAIEIVSDRSERCGIALKRNWRRHEIEH